MCSTVSAFNVEAAAVRADSTTLGAALTVTVSATLETGIAAGSKSVTYRPNDNFSGTDSFTYTIRDSSGRTDTVTVTVTNP